MVISKQTILKKVERARTIIGHVNPLVIGFSRCILFVSWLFVQYPTIASFKASYRLSSSHFNSFFPDPRPLVDEDKRQAQNKSCM